MIRVRFADYFKKQWMSRPEVQLSAQRGVRGWSEEFRADIFQNVGYPSKKWESPLGSQFSASIYTIIAPHLSVVLALYNDNTLLWLDDHSSDTDFAEFIRRENLLLWLPNQLDKFVELLVETKFNFLGWPQFLSKASDIDKVPDEIKDKQSLFGHQHMEAMLDAEKRIDEIMGIIHPPTLDEYEEGEFRLQFYIWTKLFGRVIKLTCFLGGDDLFSYEGIQLAHDVGFNTIPR